MGSFLREGEIMTGQCLCGAVSVTIDAKPDFINDCNCSLCRKVGGAWGYFCSTSVKTTGDTLSTMRPDRKSPGVEIHACKNCATTTHWVLTDSFKMQNPTVDQMGVNMRLFDLEDLDGIEVRFPNGNDWTGDGPYGFRRPPITICDRTPW